MMLSKTLVKLDKVLKGKWLSFKVLPSSLKTGLISATFIKFGKIFSFRQSFKISLSFS